MKTIQFGYTMRRQLNLRQIEAFKAVIENGTVSRAAEVLHMSQPATSKLIAHLESDTGLALFDRVKGRLAPTPSAMELHEEIDRIFAGVRQLEDAVEDIRRAEQGRLSIGVLPALADSFIQEATLSFLEDQPNVFCSVQSRSSHWIVEWLVARKLDIGLVSSPVANPYVILEPIMNHRLVCIMPPDHPLAEKSHVEPTDLNGIPFISFNSDIYVGRQIEAIFDAYNVKLNVALVSNATSTICQYVAKGLGVSLIHPLMTSGVQDDLVMRRFEPEILDNFQLCRSLDSRNSKLIDSFAEKVRDATANFQFDVC